MLSKEYFRECPYGTIYQRDRQMTVRHRERGLPACEWLDGDKTYWENDMRHRLDGFAVDYSRSKHHDLNGKRLFTKNK